MRKMLKHIAILGGLCFLAFLFIYSAHRYSIQSFDFFNTLCYLGCYILFPILIILLGYKHSTFRWYSICAMSVVIIATSMIYYTNTEIIENDLSNYLVGDSEFVQIATRVLPAKDEIALSEHANYRQRKSNSGYEIIELHISCAPEIYSSIVSNVEINITRMQNVSTYSLFQITGEQEDVFIDGHIYTCFLLHTKNGYYAVAYSRCSDCYSVSWLLFTNEYLSYMSIADALTYCE